MSLRTLRVKQEECISSNFEWERKNKAWYYGFAYDQPGEEQYKRQKAGADIFQRLKEHENITVNAEKKLKDHTKAWVFDDKSVIT